MVILVIGSEGTIGKPLVESLKAKGHTVFTSDLKHNHDLLVTQYANIEGFTRCDISKYRELENILLLHNYDYIYVLAAEFGRMNGEDFYERLWETNVIGIKNLLSIIQTHDVKSKVIFFSSSEVYGELTTPDGILHEDDMLKYSVIQHNDYAITKWVNEKQIINAQKENPRLNIFRVRLFNAYGKGEFYTNYRSVVCLFCYRMLYNLPITIYRDYYRVFMHIDDLIITLCRIPEINWELLNKNVINIGGEEYCSIENMYSIIKTNIPYCRSVVTMLEKDGHNTVCKRPGIEKAKTILNHDPSIFLLKGIPLTLNWMIKEYKLNRALIKIS